ncbi:MAG: glycoside hydrolase family 15 protein [bacterium]
MYKKISDYGIIGNLHSIALIGIDGSIDWLCFPHIDDPSIFGALLDDKKGGRFSIFPSEDYDSVAEYLPDTNILKTRFRTRSGLMELIDFMPVPYSDEEEPEAVKHELYRLVKMTKGGMRIKVVFEPRFNYAMAHTSVKKSRGGLIAQGDGESITLSCTRPLKIEKEIASADWDLSEGDLIWFHLIYGAKQCHGIDPGVAEKVLLDTEKFWRQWLKRSETGRSVNLGPYREMLNRSALVLKLLYYGPIGTIAAAATTSLPEEIGGVRNWDYRFTWVRDTSFTLKALYNLGHLSETEGYLRWIERLISEHGAGALQIMYGLRGEKNMPEETLSHLDGYKGSRPVRIGNEAANQKQLDIYGEIMDAALKLSDYVGKIDVHLWPFLRDICDYVVEHWQEKDSGIWEVRGGTYLFVYSKVMCWVALDRGITIARRYGFPGDLKKWEETKKAIRKEVMERGWSEEKNAYVQHYETDALDSSNLLIPIMGFLPFDDPRVIATIEAIQKELSHDGLLYRYIADDGLSGEEGTFLLCTFWLVDCLLGLNRLDEAESLLRLLEKAANPLGLFSEEYDVKWKEALGNFPQAFTHIGYINSVIALNRAKGDMAGTAETIEDSRGKRFLLTSKVVLNEGDPREHIRPNEIAPKLKRMINILRGAFFDTKRGRVAYEQMAHSKVYKEYLELSNNLKSLDLDSLKDRKERLAFWINLYNAIVIHGVIELGIRDSVKEVRNFFRVIHYQIGKSLFSPDDIEHGILRGNRRPPNAIFKLFKGRDRRLKQVISPIEPRVHFALVCASSSCPPIEVYTAENLDAELAIAAETFLNSGGVIIDRERNRVSLSRIFKWYAEDFGKTQSERLRFVSRYLHNDKDKGFLQEKGDTVTIDFQDYDWRLNRN